MATPRLFAILSLFPVAAIACSKEAPPSPGASATAATATAATKSTAAKSTAAKSRLEKVTMNGVAWEVMLPEDMKAPQYKVKNPEYLGDDDMTLKLDATFPKFSTVDAYVERNVGDRLLEKKQIGDAFVLVLKPQAHNAGSFQMTGMVPGQNIGWHCSGAAAREADIRAMCTSVKFKKE